jgi:hypothetical protein
LVKPLPDCGAKMTSVFGAEPHDLAWIFAIALLIDGTPLLHFERF